MYSFSDISGSLNSLGSTCAEESWCGTAWAWSPGDQAAPTLRMPLLQTGGLGEVSLVGPAVIELTMIVPLAGLLAILRSSVNGLCEKACWAVCCCQYWRSSSSASLTSELEWLATAEMGRVKLRELW
ncbi:hypothetical protein B0H67DRAFT_593003 [Lasiosphaeris hirsuta]|uniref:Uncharacterized protein n=1 Tax=Lasiosphaeris hirsuta TaxID=260670 RepID=A0AA40DIP4_9PEZI|nr:hypothetical protein B0H67DRAFT_593003 [Lasiosphaeris hirsuta]